MWMYQLQAIHQDNKRLMVMVGITLEVQNTNARSLSKREQNLVDKIRRKHGVVRQKNAAINKPVHRNEFKRSCLKRVDYEECKVSRFYFTSKEEFDRALKEFYGITKHHKIKYQQVGYVNVNLRLCCRCRDAEKALKTDLYFVNILDYSSHIRETLCYGCIGAMINKFHDAEMNN